MKEGACFSVSFLLFKKQDTYPRDDENDDARIYREWSIDR